MNTDLTTKLLKKILWYQPKEAQYLVVPNKHNEELQRLELINFDDICGVQFTFEDRDEIKTEFNFIKALDCSNDRPLVSSKILQCKHMGVIGYGMQHLMKLNKNRKYKKKVYEKLSELYSILYCNYTPSKVSSTLNWGVELLIAYLSAKEDIDVDLYVGTSTKQVPNAWDLHSRLMAGELLTELDVNIIEKRSRYLCKLSVLTTCDYLIYNSTDKNKDSFMRVAKELNKPVIRMESW